MLPSATSNPDHSDHNWQPAAAIEMIRLRAEVFAKLRRFFAERGVLEVETPVVSHDTAVDSHLEPFSTRFHAAGSQQNGVELFLQTSPEFAMKRLLAAGSGDIYQVTRAFRNGETGPLHNPEFTIVEWYRVGWDHHQLMDEVAELVSSLIDVDRIKRFTYSEAFEHVLGLNPLRAELAELARAATDHAATAPPKLADDDHDGWLNFALATCVEPWLKQQAAVFLYNYPASQAVLARTSFADGIAVAERFELYIDGMELCNGFHELTGPDELVRRNREQNRRRIRQGQTALPEHSALLACMRKGLPECAGVALGFDRLIMLAAGATRVQEVIAFPFERA